MKNKIFYSIFLVALMSGSLFAKTDKALVQAVEQGDVPAVRAMLESGADVNTWNKGKTPIFLATENDDGAMVRELLNPQWNIDIKKTSGAADAFLSAVWNGKTNAVEAFINAEYDIPAVAAKRSAQDVLVIAAGQCHAGVVDLLVKKYKSRYDQPNSKFLGQEARNHEYYEDALLMAKQQMQNIEALLQTGTWEESESFGVGVTTKLVAEIKTPEDEQYWQDKQEQCGEIIAKMKHLSSERTKKQIAAKFKQGKK